MERGRSGAEQDEKQKARKTFAVNTEHRAELTHYILLDIQGGCWGWR